MASRWRRIASRGTSGRRAERVWTGDVTFIPTTAGWCYLAVVIDAFSRRVVGWALDTQVTAELPLRRWHRRSRSGGPPGLLHHSDRGVQHACRAYQATLAGRTWSSMSRRADCWDNAVVESFFASLKVERLHERRYATVEELRGDVADYIDRFYNRQRRHSTLGYLSPAIYELRHAA